MRRKTNTQSLFSLRFRVFPTMHTCDRNEYVTYVHFLSPQTKLRRRWQKIRVYRPASLVDVRCSANCKQLSLTLPDIFLCETTPQNNTRYSLLQKNVQKLCRRLPGANLFPERYQTPPSSAHFLACSRVQRPIGLPLPYRIDMAATRL